MKLPNYTYLLLLTAGLFAITSCKKDIDNLTPAPALSVDSISIIDTQINDTTKTSGTSVFVPYDTDVTIPFTIHAEGKIEQVDYKVTGSNTYTVVNSSNVPVQTQSVPFDWVGLMTIRSGFDSENDFTFFIKLSKVTNRVITTVQVIDKNGLKSFMTIIAYPLTAGGNLTGLKLYSQKSTAADAGGSESDRKMFLASTDETAYDTASAKINSHIIDIGFADSNGLAILVSPEYAKTATDNAAGVVNLTNNLTTKFILSPVDINTATLQTILSVNFANAKSYIKITAGQSYIYRNSSGVVGIIKANSINNGSASSQPNAELDLDYKSFIPLQYP